eukprot:SAG31_NODE_5228_length_2662_cov_1.697620_2_plen_134_part_00
MGTSRKLYFKYTAVYVMVRKLHGTSKFSMARVRAYETERAYNVQCMYARETILKAGRWLGSSGAWVGSRAGVHRSRGRRSMGRLHHMGGHAAMLLGSTPRGHEDHHEGDHGGRRHHYCRAASRERRCNGQTQP